MKTTNYIGILFFWMLLACNSSGKNDNYHQGDPVILKKEYSLLPGVCMYTYEGYGRKETFEDKCDKYSVGNQLGGNIKAMEKDTIKTETK